ncbi:MAG: hypothetical protein ACLFTI_07890 [Anaerolineales bacterium]
MNALRILVGLMLIVLGRQLFWFWVAGMGLVTTVEAVGQLALALPYWPESSARWWRPFSKASQ